MLWTHIIDINTVYFKRARLPRRLSTIDGSRSFCNRCAAKISRIAPYYNCKLSGPNEFHRVRLHLPSAAHGLVQPRVDTL